MAGIEPASEKIQYQTSTGLAGHLFSSEGCPPSRENDPTSRSGPKALFHLQHGIAGGTPAFSRPYLTQPELGRGGRDPLRGQALCYGLGRNRKSRVSAIGT
jgi:hypothetical protein